MAKQGGNGKPREPSLLSVLQAIQSEFRKANESANRRFGSLELAIHRADDHERRLRRLESKLNL